MLPTYQEETDFCFCLRRDPSHALLRWDVPGKVGNGITVTIIPFCKANLIEALKIKVAKSCAGVRITETRTEMVAQRSNTLNHSKIFKKKKDAKSICRLKSKHCAPYTVLSGPLYFRLSFF